MLLNLAFLAKCTPYQTYLCLLLLHLKLSNTNWDSIWNKKHYIARKPQKNSTNKQPDHLENANLLTNNIIFKSLFSLLIFTIMYKINFHIRYIFDQPQRNGRQLKKGEDGNTKTLISRERKKLLR